MKTEFKIIIIMLILVTESRGPILIPKQISGLLVIQIQQSHVLNVGTFKRKKEYFD